MNDQSVTTLPESPTAIYESAQLALPERTTFQEKGRLRVRFIQRLQQGSYEIRVTIVAVLQWCNITAN